jgi:hypothetical protein
VSFQSLADGVAHNPDSFPPVGKAEIIGSNDSPRRSIPQGGKVSDNGIQSSGNKEWRVFHKDVSRSNLTDDPGHVLPQSGLVPFNAGALPNCGYVLTREAAAHDINAPTPGRSIERLDIIPDREAR